MRLCRAGKDRQTPQLSLTASLRRRDWSESGFPRRVARRPASKTSASLQSLKESALRQCSKRVGRRCEIPETRTFSESRCHRSVQLPAGLAVVSCKALFKTSLPLFACSHFAACATRAVNWLRSVAVKLAFAVSAAIFVRDCSFCSTRFIIDTTFVFWGLFSARITLVQPVFCFYSNDKLAWALRINSASFSAVISASKRSA